MPGWDYQAQVHYSKIIFKLLCVQQDGIVGETLLENAEQFGRIVSSSLIKNTSNANSTQIPSIEKENIGM